MSCVIESNRTWTLLDCSDSGLSTSGNILGIATFAVALLATYFAFFQDIRDIPSAADDYSNDIRCLQNQVWAIGDIHGQLANLVANGGIRISDVHLQSRLKQGQAESLKEAHKFLDDYSQAYQSVFTNYFEKHRWFVRIRWLSLQKRVEHFKVQTSVLRETLTLDLLSISVNLNFAMHNELRSRDTQRDMLEDKVDRLMKMHAPIASPFAGADVQKVVYVSSKTPLMAAVKRVRKFLMQIEKRATQDVRLVERGEREGMRRLVEARERMKKEEVMVKASGRAMAKAVAVGRWFEDKETEWQLLGAVEEEANATAPSIVAVDVGPIAEGLAEQNEHVVSTSDVAESAAEPARKKKRRKRTRKRRALSDTDEMPEQRLRWIKTVEVAISFKA
ncbi:hypothetical protein DV737_g1355, partial [Chaetothyriales sp. CBS 132003]